MKQKFKVNIIDKVTEYVPVLKEIKCAEFPPPTNGISACSTATTNPGNTCTIDCAEGFHLTGPGIITCGDGTGVNGKWVDDNQACKSNDMFIYTYMHMHKFNL